MDNASRDAFARRVRLSPSQTLAIAARAKEMERAGEKVVSFGAGEPDFATPEPAAEAAREAIALGLTKYTPAEGILELRAAVCEKLGRDNGLVYDPSQIVISGGAKHSVFNACSALVDEGDEAIVPSPYWLSYPEIVKACGGVPVAVKTDRRAGYKITPDRLRAALTPKTKLFLFNSPCNPTGAVYTKEETRALAAVCEEAGIWTISDEIYEKFVYDGAKPFSFAASSAYAKEHTVTVNGVSKTYAMTGWRIGYLAAPHAAARAIGSFQSHTAGSPNTVAQYAALRALRSCGAAAEEMAARYAERRRAMIARLSRMRGVSFAVPCGAFYVMLDVSGVYGKRAGGKPIEGSAGFAEALLEDSKVAVVPGAPFGADECVRLSYTLPTEEMAEGLDRIAAFLDGLK